MQDKACAVLENETNVLIAIIDSALILLHKYLFGIKQRQAANNSNNEPAAGRLST